MPLATLLQGPLQLNSFLGTERKGQGMFQALCHPHFPSVGLGSTPHPTTPIGGRVTHHTVGLRHLSAPAFFVSFPAVIPSLLPTHGKVLSHRQNALSPATHAEQVAHSVGRQS